jgi:D-amino-acid dehydrogenase
VEALGGSQDADVVVVGAGIVGLASALHLQDRGFRVVVFDPGAPRGRASFGNAGVLSRNSIFPVAGPGVRRRLVRYGLGRDVAVRVRAGSLPRLLPWFRHFIAAADEAHWRDSARLLDSLVARAFESHLELAGQVGARHLIRANGWLRLYRDKAALDASALERAVLAEHHVRADVLSAEEIRQMEPGLTRRFSHGVFFADSGSVESPGELVDFYARAVAERGGRFVTEPVRRIEAGEGALAVHGAGTTVHARFVVLAAGARSGDLARPLGYRFPLAAERGYHRHFALANGVSLNRPVHDAAGGYVLSPMAGAVRLLTGVELALPDDPPDHRQIERVTADARSTIALSDAIEPEPWMGSRPSTPDGRPIIGRSSRHPGLIFAFGHGHIGFANGPFTGRIVADLVTGSPPPIDIDGFSPRRFGG